MTKWEVIKGRVVVGDVVRWHEGIPDQNPRRRSKKPRLVGRWQVTAQVEACWTGGFISLIVLKCEITQNFEGRELIPMKKGALIRRKRATLAGAEKRLEPEPPKAITRSRFLRD